MVLAALEVDQHGQGGADAEQGVQDDLQRTLLLHVEELCEAGPEEQTGESYICDADGLGQLWPAVIPVIDCGHCRPADQKVDARVVQSSEKGFVLQALAQKQVVNRRTAQTKGRSSQKHEDWERAYLLRTVGLGRREVEGHREEPGWVSRACVEDGQCGEHNQKEAQVQPDVNSLVVHHKKGAENLEVGFEVDSVPGKDVGQAHGLRHLLGQPDEGLFPLGKFLHSAQFINRTQIRWNNSEDTCLQQWHQFIYFLIKIKCNIHLFWDNWLPLQLMKGKENKKKIAFLALSETEKEIKTDPDLVDYFNVSCLEARYPDHGARSLVLQRFIASFFSSEGRLFLLLQHYKQFVADGAKATESLQHEIRLLEEACEQACCQFYRSKFERVRELLTSRQLVKAKMQLFHVFRKGLDVQLAAKQLCKIKLAEQQLFSFEVEPFAEFEEELKEVLSSEDQIDLRTLEARPHFSK